MSKPESQTTTCPICGKEAPGTNPPPCKECHSKTTPELLETIGRLLDSRIDTTGDAQKPKSLVETICLDKLERLTEKIYDRI